MSKSQTLRFEFGEKHIAYMRRCRDCAVNVAEGAVRAGKTVDNVFVFADELDHAPDKIHLATGSTIANAKLNLGVCNGLGLEGLFRGRCRWGKYKDNDALFVKTPVGEKIIIFAGGAKADSFKKIRGNSYGMWIATEINLHHDSMIKEAFNRQLAAAHRKVFWDLNPDHPQADIYTKYIDFYTKQMETGSFPAGYNYEHFTIRDNLAITPERLAEIESQYDKTSIWYRRDILGQRCIAEGLIYPEFASAVHSAENPFLLKESPHLFKLAIGVDFGGNGSSHTFVATGITPGYQNIIALASERHPGGIDPEQLSSLFVAFVKGIYQRYGIVSAIYCDSAEQVLIRGLISALRKAGCGWIAEKVHNAAKIQINDRIYLTAGLMAQGRFYYLPAAETLAKALSSCVWNPKKMTSNERLDDGTSDIDSLDAFEYTIEQEYKRILKGGVPT